MSFASFARKVQASERGTGSLLVLALAGALLGVLVVVPVLSLGDTMIRTRARLTQPPDFYARDAGIEHATWRLLYESGFLGLVATGLAAPYVITVNGVPVTVTVSASSAVGTALPKLFVSVSPQSIDLGDLPAPVTYKMDIVNSSGSLYLLQLTNSLDSHFSYVPGSSSGMTFANPSIQGVNLTWSFSPPLEVAGNTTVTQWFRALVPAGTSTGVYLDGASAKTTGTDLKAGSVAPVNVIAGGTLEVTLQTTPPNPAPGVATTFFYVLTMRNDGTDSLTIKRITSWTYSSFTFVPGSATLASGGSCGGAAVDDPSRNSGTQNGPFDTKFEWGPAQLKPSLPLIIAANGGLATFCFQSSATLELGTYYGLAEVDADGQGGAHTYATTGQTSPVNSNLTALIQAEAKGRISRAVVTRVPDGTLINLWEAR